MNLPVYQVVSKGAVELHEKNRLVGKMQDISSVGFVHMQLPTLCAFTELFLATAPICRSQGEGTDRTRNAPLCPRRCVSERASPGFSQAASPLFSGARRFFTGIESDKNLITEYHSHIEIERPILGSLPSLQTREATSSRLLPLPNNTRDSSGAW